MNSNEDRISKILQEFEADKIAKMMEAVGWKWRGKRVTPEMVLDKARRLMNDSIGVYAERGAANFHASGGLCASCNEEGYLQIEFATRVFEEEADNTDDCCRSWLIS